MTQKGKYELVPVWEKCALTLDEAIAYSGLGRQILIKYSDEPDCSFVMWSGKKRLFKRKKLDEFIEKIKQV